MSTFVDTSALYALMDANDVSHEDALRYLDAIGDEPLLTHAAIVTETTALLDRRLGTEATQGFIDVLLPTIQVHHPSAGTFGRAITAYRMGSGRRRPSLTDHLSFEVMRDLQIGDAFAYDGHFTTAGFTLVP